MTPILIAAALVAAGAAAHAHAYAVLDGAAAPGATSDVAVRLGHGWDGLPAGAVEATIPDAPTGVRPMAKRGWMVESKPGLPAPAPLLRVADASHAGHGASHAGHGAAHGAAREGALGPIRVTGGFVRAAATSGGASAAYMTVATEGAADRLIAAASPAAARVELHTHLLDDAGVARMRQVEAIDVAPGVPAELEPGGFHVMMMGVTERLEEGDTVELTLSFEAAGDLTVTLPVRAAGGQAHQH